VTRQKAAENCIIRIFTIVKDSSSNKEAGGGQDMGQNTRDEKRIRNFGRNHCETEEELV